MLSTPGKTAVPATDPKTPSKDPVADSKPSTKKKEAPPPDWFNFKDKNCWLDIIARHLKVESPEDQTKMLPFSLVHVAMKTPPRKFEDAIMDALGNIYGKQKKEKIGIKLTLKAWKMTDSEDVLKLVIGEQISETQISIAKANFELIDTNPNAPEKTQKMVDENKGVQAMEEERQDKFGESDSQSGQWDQDQLNEEDHAQNVGYSQDEDSEPLGENLEQVLEAYLNGLKGNKIKADNIQEMYTKHAEYVQRLGYPSNPMIYTMHDMMSNAAHQLLLEKTPGYTELTREQKERLSQEPDAFEYFSIQMDNVQFGLQGSRPPHFPPLMTEQDFEEMIKDDEWIKKMPAFQYKGAPKEKFPKLSDQVRRSKRSQAKQKFRMRKPKKQHKSNLRRANKMTLQSADEDNKSNKMTKTKQISKDSTLKPLLKKSKVLPSDDEDHKPMPKEEDSRPKPSKFLSGLAKVKVQSWFESEQAIRLGYNTIIKNLYHATNEFEEVDIDIAIDQGNVKFMTDMARIRQQIDTITPGHVWKVKNVVIEHMPQQLKLFAPLWEKQTNFRSQTATDFKSHKLPNFQICPQCRNFNSAKNTLLKGFCEQCRGKISVQIGKIQNWLKCFTVKIGEQEIDPISPQCVSAKEISIEVDQKTLTQLMQIKIETFEDWTEVDYMNLMEDLVNFLSMPGSDFRYEHLQQNESSFSDDIYKYSTKQTVKDYKNLVFNVQSVIILAPNHARRPLFDMIRQLKNSYTRVICTTKGLTAIEALTTQELMSQALRMSPENIQNAMENSAATRIQLNRLVPQLYRFHNNLTHSRDFAKIHLLPKIITRALASKWTLGAPVSAATVKPYQDIKKLGNQRIEIA